MSQLRPVKETINRVRTRMAHVTLLHDVLQALLMVGMLLTTYIWYESKLYFSSSVRGVAAFAIMDGILFLIVFIILRWFGIWHGWWNWVRADALAHRIGRRLGEKADRLLNALQLERSLEEASDLPNREIIEHAVKSMSRELSLIDYRTLLPRRYQPPRKRLIVILAVMILAWGIDYGGMAEASTRIFSPSQEFDIPKPFTLNVISGDKQVLGGDTTAIVIMAEGAPPLALELVWTDQEEEEYATIITGQGNLFTYSFNYIRSDIRYFARYKNPNWFAPWSEITSEQHLLSLLDRPVIEDLQFHITPPAYTQSKGETVGGNVADITVLAGSEVEFEAVTNLELATASYILDGRRYLAKIDSNKVNGFFVVEKSVKLSITVQDHRQVKNINPIQYSFTAFPDYAPSLTMLLPLNNIDLDESLLLAIRFDVDDDYGFSRAQITYEIRHPEYLTQDDQIYTHGIGDLALDKKHQRVNHVWDLGQINLVPGDRIVFHLEVYDNNTVSGPGKAVSQTLEARIPTLADLFAQASESTDKASDATEQVLEDVAAIRKLLEEMDIALKGEDSIPWEQQRKGKELLKNLREVLSELEKVQSDMREMGAMAEQNKLFSDDLAKKYERLQELLDAVMTPELREAMDAMRKALDELDPEKLKSALKNLQFNASEFEAQLDRFLEIFKLAVAEMKMGEVVERVERMAAAEQQMLNQLQQSDYLSDSSKEETNDETNWSERGNEAGSSWRMQDMAARHEEQNFALDALTKAMEDAARAIRPYSNSAADRLRNLRRNDIVNQVKTSLEAGTRLLKSEDAQASEGQMSQSRDRLNEIYDMASAIEQEFHDATVIEKLDQFHRVLNGVLTLSKNQEELMLETEGLAFNSPRIRGAAQDQHQLLQGLTQLTAQLIELSKESFYISPAMGRAIGKVNLAMIGTIKHLEDNQPREAAKVQQDGLTGLNEAAIAINNAMSQMRSGGSASGYEQYLERMANLSQGQGGVNEQSLALLAGNLSAASKLELMRRLQARQKYLSQTLEEILRDYPNQTGGERGGLGQAEKDMEAVIQDFQRRRINQRTIENQQRILSRLLDAQKSLTEQDFENERKGTVAQQQFAFDGPSGLPANLGEREDMILQALEKALRAGYSPEYQQMIQNYFRQLAAKIDNR